MLATFPTIKFDMRMIAKGEYEVQFLKDSAVVSRATIGLTTKCSMPSSGQGMRAADIAAAQKVYTNEALLNLEDRLVEYPELYYLLKWFTQAQYNDNGVWRYASEKAWQRGIDMLAEVKDLGIGVTKNDSFFDYWFTADPHPARQLVTDSSGEAYTDSNGEFYID